MEIIIAQFIPIILIYLLVSNTNDFILFSHSILGRLVAILLVLFYSSIDKFLGLIVCGSIILFYQLDYNNQFLNIATNFIEMLEDRDDDGNKEKNDNTYRNVTTLLSNNFKQYTNYDDLYKTNANLNKIKNIAVNKPENDFQKDYCDKNGVLMHKGSVINLEMVEHLFPELKFLQGKCNPCDNNCKYTIIGKKLLTEEKMVPISTMA